MSTTPVTSPAASSPGDARASRYAVLQRAALHDMIELSTSCVAAENEARQKLQQARETAERRLRKTLRRLQQRREPLVQALDQHHAQEMTALREQYTKACAEREATQKKQYTQAVATFDAKIHRLQQDYEHTLWVADSVLDASKQKAAEAYTNHKEALAEQVAAVEEMGQRFEKLCARNRLCVPSGIALSEAKVAAEEAGTGAQGSAAVAMVDDPVELFRRHREQVDQLFEAVRVLPLPRLFRGIVPVVMVLCIAGAAAGVAYALTGGNLQTTGIAGGGAAVLMIALGFVLRAAAQKQMRNALEPLVRAIEDARRTCNEQRIVIVQRRDQVLRDAEHHRNEEIQRTRAHYKPLIAEMQQKRTVTLQEMIESHKMRREQEAREHEQQVREAQERYEKATAALRERYDRYETLARQRHDRAIAEAQQAFDRVYQHLQARWQEGAARIAALDQRTRDLPPVYHANGEVVAWTPAQTFAESVPFGRMHVDVTRLFPRRGESEFRLTPPPPFHAPALLSFPEHGSLFIQYNPDGREQALRTLQATVYRLLTMMPPGRARFTFIDPVGLGQSFAGFMHLVDYSEALVGVRIWTEADQIEQRLIDMTTHMENVIQKYLRNEFETIDAYNAQAGELAEPYRFLVIADLPANFSEESMRRLASIVNSGARCGVYTLIAMDQRQELPGGVALEDIVRGSAHLVQESDGRFVWRDPVFAHYPLTLAEPPDEEALNRALHEVGQAARQCERVEVAFEAIAPNEAEMWTGDCSTELRVPIGRLGATRLQHLRLGRGLAQHALIAGKTGSGKSTLLHVLVCSIAMWYSPDEVELYLIDFKKGVEFKAYATHNLPHARAIAIESDREFGLSVLQKLDAEMQRRGDLYRQLGAQDLAGYRKASGQSMPRTLLIIDEFQEFFSEDDKIAQDAALLLDRLVRQGRAFGIHVLLGSQTLAGAAGLARSTMGQMAIRIALNCTEADSQLILGDGNTAARLLSRPGEAIYNDAGGAIEANSPFQVAWLDDEKRDAMLRRIAAKVADRSRRAIVFEGQAAPDPAANAVLETMLAAAPARERSTTPVAFLGEPITIKDPTAAQFRRQSGDNLLIVGQRDDLALTMMQMSVISLAAQHPREAAHFAIIDGTPVDAPFAGVLPAMAQVVGHRVEVIDYRQVEQWLAQTATEVQRRHDEHVTDAPALYILIFGLQRYRMLRRQDDMGFSFGAEDTPPSPDRLLADILRDGPSVGVHVLAWCDSPNTLERIVDRQSMREFDQRVLFQMSAADSSNLIDSPEANRLGLYRALYCSEERGIREKFRPYMRPSTSWLDTVRQRLRGN